MDIKEQITLDIFIVIMMFHGNLRGCDERVDIIEGTREDFSEKVTFKQRLLRAAVGQVMGGGWCSCRETAC